MSASTVWLVLSASLCVAVVPLWLKTPFVAGDDRTVRGMKRCSGIAFLALITAAGAAGSWMGLAAVACGLLLLFVLARIQPMVFVFIFIPVLVLASLGVVVWAGGTLIGGTGDPLRVMGLGLAAIALSQMLLGVHCAVGYGFT
jgi:hypothetical protein